jgi:hypothetical protein
MYGGYWEGETARTLSAYSHLDAVDAVIERRAELCVAVISEGPILQGAGYTNPLMIYQSMLLFAWFMNQCSCLPYATVGTF